MRIASADADMMTGDPRRAIKLMSIPLMVAIFIDYVQHFVDSVWCAGLGASAISAITVAGPLYWIIIDIGIGLGVGASTSIARALGAKDKGKADSLSSQAVALSVIIAAASMLILILVSDPVLSFMNDGGDIGLCRQYVLPYYVCLIPIVVHGTLIGILRSEGAGRKVLILSIVSASLNLVIDPIFIYVFGWGVTGAAMATCVSYIVPTVIGLWWYHSGRMHIRMSFRRFRIRPDEMMDVIYVGIPHMLELMAISVLMIPQNMLVVRTGGEAGMVYALTPYKFIMLLIIPANGLAQAMIPVTSALQGAGDMKKAKDGFLYTILVSSVIGIILSMFLLTFADPLMHLFTYTEEMSAYHPELVRVLKMYSIIVLFAGATEVFSGILQSLRRPLLATLTMFVRESVFILAYWYASTISMEAIYHSMVFGMFFGAAMMGLFAVHCVRRMKCGPATV